MFCRLSHDRISLGPLLAKMIPGDYDADFHRSEPCADRRAEIRGHLGYNKEDEECCRKHHARDSKLGSWLQRGLLWHSMLDMTESGPRGRNHVRAI